MRKQFLIILFVCVVIVFGYLVWHSHKNNTSISSKDINLKQILSQQKTGKSSQSISTSIKDIGSQQTNSNDEISNLIDIINNTELKVEERMRAAIRLKEFEAHEAYEPFLKLANNKEEDVYLRSKAVRALGKLGDMDAIPTLSLLLHDLQEEEHLRIVAALALGNLGGKDAVQSLSEAIYDNNKYIRFKALQGLKKTRDISAIEPVIIGLKDSDKYVRAEAIQALGILGDQTHVPLLKDILDNTHEGFIKIECIGAIGDLGGDEAKSILEEYANDTNKLLRINALNALKNIKR